VKSHNWAHYVGGDLTKAQTRSGKLTKDLALLPKVTAGKGSRGASLTTLASWLLLLEARLAEELHKVGCLLLVVLLADAVKVKPFALMIWVEAAMKRPFPRSRLVAGVAHPGIARKHRVVVEGLALLLRVCKGAGGSVHAAMANDLARQTNSALLVKSIESRDGFHRERESLTVVV
jgi:hypothetical protein